MAKPPKRQIIVPAPPADPSPGNVNVVYGHNVEQRAVLMQITTEILPAPLRFFFTPEDARAFGDDVQKKLRHYADMAEGKKGM